MNKFKVLFPDGGLINQNTLIKGVNNSYKITTEIGLCQVIKNAWCKEQKVKSFTQWAKELNDTGHYDSVFTTLDALDNLCSNFHVEINGKAIDLHDFFCKHLPLKKAVN